MSSFYSLPDRQRFENIPMKDFNQPQQNEHTEIMERIEHNERNRKNRNYKWSIYALGALLFITTILTVVFAGLYFSHRGMLPSTPTNGTVLTSTATTTTSVLGKDFTTTHTLTPLMQTTVHTETDVSPTTIEVTKTSVLTVTDTTSVIVTQSSKPKACENSRQYGGQELHNINSDYDLLLIDAMDYAVRKGLNVGDATWLDVALRSVFQCTDSPSIELVDACQSTFEHRGGSVVCNSMGSYPYTTQLVTMTTTSTRN